VRRPTAAELEGIEIRALLDLCRANPREVSRTRVGSALAVVLPDVPPILGHRVVGLGVESPASPLELDSLLDWMTARDPEFAVALAPASRPARLFEMLIARGFVPGYAWSKLHRDATAPVPDMKSDVEVRVAAGAGDADAFAELVSTSFGVGERFAPLARSIVGRAGWHVVLAWDGPRAVGCGVLFSRGDLGWLGFGATASSHQRQGVHGGVIRERLRIARQLGLTTLAVETGVREAGRPDASLRNLEGVGFREAYVRANLLSAKLHEWSVTLRSAG
jgi:hypothetical protein